MAEDAIFGKAARERVFEGINIVDALADERAFLKPVLIDIGNSPCIGVNTRIIAVEPGVSGAVHAGQAHGNAGLQNAVALPDALLTFIVMRPIERMRHDAD